jgi:hypothetical protein
MLTARVFPARGTAALSAMLAFTLGCGASANRVDDDNPRSNFLLAQMTCSDDPYDGLPLCSTATGQEARDALIPAVFGAVAMTARSTGTPSRRSARRAQSQTASASSAPIAGTAGDAEADPTSVSVPSSEPPAPSSPLWIDLPTAEQAAQLARFFVDASLQRAAQTTYGDNPPHPLPASRREVAHACETGSDEGCLLAAATALLDPNVDLRTAAGACGQLREQCDSLNHFACEILARALTCPHR